VHLDVGYAHDTFVFRGAKCLWKTLSSVQLGEGLIWSDECLDVMAMNTPMRTLIAIGSSLRMLINLQRFVKRNFYTYISSSPPFWLLEAVLYVVH